MLVCVLTEPLRLLSPTPSPALAGFVVKEFMTGVVKGLISIRQLRCFDCS